MKKIAIFILGVMLFSCAAQAGSNTCSGTTNLTWYVNNPYYTFVSTDCVVDVTQGDQANSSNLTSLLTTLPSSPSNGDRFTLADTTPYSMDYCTSYYDDPQWGGTGNTYSYCMPAGIGMQSTTSVTIGNDSYGYSQEFVDAEMYFTSCVDANNNPCSLSGYPTQQRDADTVIYNSSTANWDLAINAAP